ncbi:TraR/DksA family transcriptional regulator [Dactylosporangium sp. NBC_01737]|uniref:TraR/DksA family transcriptional regulator n=1 Tax=Dactylosporangium sp. NBC_01737 TaxID=2975959 RepID=UPI002E0E9326|nr:TraR/DksA family transcriptional regulator [Dactylosporangium sp. NBC_01737]
MYPVDRQQSVHVVLSALRTTWTDCCAPRGVAACGMRDAGAQLCTVAAGVELPSPPRTSRGPPGVRASVAENDHQGEASQLRPFFVGVERTTVMSTNMQAATDRAWIEALRQTLLEHFELQTARLTQLTADTGDPGQEHTRAAMTVNVRQSLEQITGALERIAQGRYGNCDRCGMPIPRERLQVLPHARCCVPCQQRHGS